MMMTGTLKRLGKERGRLLLGGAAALVLSGCTSLDVRSDYADGASFTGLQTYEWVDSDRSETGDPAIDNPLHADRIRTSVDELMEGKGFRRSIAPGTPDFRLSYEMLATETTRTFYGTGGYGYRHRYGYGYRYGYRYGYGHYGHYGRFGHYGHGFYSPSYTEPALKGTLLLNVIDAGSDEVIWRGWASGILPADPNPEDVDHYVAEAVQGILVQFPPKPEEGEAGFVATTATESPVLE